MDTLLSLVLAYLLGAIPFAYLISVLRGIDIRWVGMALFVPLPLICLATSRFLGQPSLLVVLYTVLLPCLAGFAHRLTTRHLPPEARREAGTFWIARHKGR